MAKNTDLYKIPTAIPKEVADFIIKQYSELEHENPTVNVKNPRIDTSIRKCKVRGLHTDCWVAGMLAHFGINNPFNRKQETEADYLGLIFASLAGYDIRETTKVWERMKETNKGKEPPEWMSTHPSTSRRIQQISDWIPEIILSYPPLTY